MTRGCKRRHPVIVASLHHHGEAQRRSKLLCAISFAVSYLPVRLAASWAFPKCELGRSSRPQCVTTLHGLDPRSALSCYAPSATERTNMESSAYKAPTRLASGVQSARICLAEMYKPIFTLRGLFLGRKDCGHGAMGRPAAVPQPC